MEVTERRKLTEMPIYAYVYICGAFPPVEQQFRQVIWGEI